VNYRFCLLLGLVESSVIFFICSLLASVGWSIILWLIRNKTSADAFTS
jgi:hypothetical protein